MKARGISAKTRSICNDFWQRLDDGSFSESHLRAFLPSVRDFLPNQSLVREVADCIVHPHRDRGISHIELDSVYLRVKAWRACDEGRPLKIEPLSGRMLEAFKHALSAQPRDAVAKQTGLQPGGAARLLDEAYLRTATGEWRLSQFADRRAVRMVLDIALRRISFDGAFDAAQLFTDFRRSLSVLSAEMGLRSFEDSAQRSRSELIIILLSIVQGTRFILYDGNHTEAQFGVTIPRLKSKRRATLGIWGGLEMLMPPETSRLYMPIVTSKEYAEKYVCDSVLAQLSDPTLPLALVACRDSKGALRLRVA